MEPIDGLEKLTRLLRSKAADKTSRAERRSAMAKSANEHARQPAEALIEQKLRAKVRQLVQLSATKLSINQAVIGTMLAGEFNEALYNEPKFNALVQQVHRHIESEPKLKVAFQRVVDQLSR
jgi:hypothetical protein